MSTHRFTSLPRRLGAPTLPLVAAAVVTAVVAAACGTSSAASDGTADGTDAAPVETAATSEGGAAPDDGLVLDYTAFIEGVEQPSGIGIHPTGESVAIVTDFEEVTIYDLATGTIAERWSAQLGELPEQGSTEAVVFDGDDVLVLYAEAGVIRRYDGTGEQLEEIEVGIDRPLAGAMTTGSEDTVVLITDEAAPALVDVDLATGEADTRPLARFDSTATIVGLSRTIDGQDLLVGTDEGEIFAVEADGAAVVGVHRVDGVDEPSAVEAFINPEDEAVVAVAEDGDAYNGSESPLRLFLL